jgi:hypothetical protein
MKCLKAKPPVPPYLQLGSVSLKAAAFTSKSGNLLRQIDHEWRKLTARIAGEPTVLRTVLKRLDERAEDPNYTDASFEVFYTVTEDGQGRILVDYFY